MPSILWIIIGGLCIVGLIALIIVMYKVKFKKDMQCANNLLIINSVIYSVILIGGIVCLSLEGYDYFYITKV